MRTRPEVSGGRRAAALVAVLVLCCAACGGSAANGGKDATGDVGRPDAMPTDAMPADAMPTDAGRTDGSTDGAREDGGGDSGTRTEATVMCETAGGDTVSSANYRVRLYVSPTTPVSSGQSTNYRVGLGPGAITNSR